MRCVQTGERGGKVSSWQLHYEERLFAAHEVHGAVISGQTCFLEPRVYPPRGPGSPLPRVPSTAIGLAHTCSGCTRLQSPLPSPPAEFCSIASQTTPCHPPLGLATPTLCNAETESTGIMGPFPCISPPLLQEVHQ